LGYSPTHLLVIADTLHGDDRLYLNTESSQKDNDESTLETRPEVVQELVYFNSANSKKLESLPGIGPAIASRIIEYRNKNGPFSVAHDIQKVKGIGAKKMERILPFITLKSMPPGTQVAN